jgi:hypothetical protein
MYQPCYSDSSANRHPTRQSNRPRQSRDQNNSDRSHQPPKSGKHSPPK